MIKKTKAKEARLITTQKLKCLINYNKLRKQNPK